MTSSATPLNLFAAQQCSGHINVVILIDQSTSIVNARTSTGEPALEQISLFIQQLLEQLAIEESTIQVALVSFSDSQNIRIDTQRFGSDTGFTSDLNILKNSLYVSIANPLGGTTNIASALESAERQLGLYTTTSDTGIVVLITDGDPDQDASVATNNHIQIAQRMISNHYEIITVGIGNSQAQLKQLQMMASEANGRSLYLQVTEAEDLSHHVDEIVSNTCAIAAVAQTGLPPTGTATLAPSVAPSNGSSPASQNDLTSLLPFIIGALILGIALMTWFFRRRKNDDGWVNNPPPTHPAKPAQPQGETYPAWRSHLRDLENRQPSAPSAYERFHSKVMVIGLGKSGAKILDQMVDQMDDANLLDEAALGSLTDHPHNLLLMHLSMNNVSTTLPEKLELQGRKLIENLTLTKDMRLTEREARQDESKWGWAITNNITRRDDIGRHSAKVALYREFDFGANDSHLLYTLRKYLGQGFKNIILVGSALDNLGANIMGDLAAMIRLSMPMEQEPFISAVVLTEENNMGAELDPLRQRGYLAATLTELGRLSTPGRLRLHFGPRADSIYIGDRRQPLIEAVSLIYGKDGMGNQQAANYLWGLLISLELFKNMRAKTTTPDTGQTTQVPVASIVNTYAFHWPARLQRDIMTTELMKRLIGNDYLQGRVRTPVGMCSPEELNELLDEVRGQGLLPALVAIEESNCAENSTFIRNLKDLLLRKRREYERRRNEVETRLKSLASSQRASEFPFDPIEWIEGALRWDYDYSRRQVVVRAGWTAQRVQSQIDKGFPIGMAIAPGRDESEPKEIFKVRREDLQEYIDEIYRLTQLIIQNTLASEVIAQYYESLVNHREHRAKWRNRFQSWATELSNWIQNKGQQIKIPDPWAFDLNVPQEWSNNVERQWLGITNQDKTVTFALQGRITPRIPILAFPIAVQHIREMQPMLICDAEKLTLEIFGRGESFHEVPVSLQNALTYRAAFWDFYRCWRFNGRYTFDDLGLDTSSWERTLWQFIEYYEANREQLRARVQQLDLDNPPDEIPVFVYDSDDVFSEKLEIAFKQLTNNIDKIKSFPPDSKKQPK